MAREEAHATQKYEQLGEEYAVTLDENKQLTDEVKGKDDIIKTLTKENLLLNSKIT